MREINENSVFLSAKGGVLRMLYGDGELLAEVAIPPGRVSARPYMSDLPDGAFYEADGLAVVQPRSLIASQDFGDIATHSGANPDFQPTTATRMELEMRQMIAQMAARDQSREARIRHLESVERIPANPDPAPLAEPETLDE